MRLDSRSQPGFWRQQQKPGSPAAGHRWRLWPLSRHFMAPQNSILKALERLRLPTGPRIPHRELSRWTVQLDAELA